MFKSFYDYYHYLLSQFSSFNNAAVKKLLDEALYWYNQKSNDRFMAELRKIQYYLMDAGKKREADITQNYIQWLIYLSNK